MTPKIAQDRSCKVCRWSQWHVYRAKCFNPAAMKPRERAAFGAHGAGWDGEACEWARADEDRCGMAGKKGEG